MKTQLQTKCNQLSLRTINKDQKLQKLLSEQRANLHSLKKLRKNSKKKSQSQMTSKNPWTSDD